MRTVQGGETTACKVSHNELINHYYTDEEKDLSIYDGCKKAEKPPLASSVHLQ